MALVNTVMNLRVPYKFGKFMSNCTTDDFSRRAQFHGVSYRFLEIANQHLCVGTTVV
jgi:hypothetical protein